MDMDVRKSLAPFFEPRGVAIVGARRSVGFGFTIPVFLKKHGWADRTFLVNPSGGELHGMPVYKSLADVPDPLDLAVVIVPANAVPGVMEEAGKRGIRHVVIETAGFAETGEEGQVLQSKVLSAARKHGIRVIGPNCVGVINTSNGFSTSEVLDEALAPGNIAIIAQSGVFGNVLLDNLYQRGMRISKSITLGNRIDVTESEALEYLKDDDATGVIMMYLEGAGHGRTLRETLARVTLKKPVLVLKSGRTQAGKAATASHTGSMSGRDELYHGMFAQTGAIRAGTLEELIETTKVFSSRPFPRGNRLGIVTSSGSLGAMATDCAVASGLILPDLSQDTIETVKAGSPVWMNVRNPLDVGPSGQYVKALTTLMAAPDIDMVLAITIIPYIALREYGPLGFTGKAWFGDIAALKKEFPEKPLIVCAPGNSEFTNHMKEISGPDVPVLSSPELSAKALARMYRYAARIKKKS